MIDTNTRSLRKIDNGAFTVTPKSQDRTGKVTLCDICGSKNTCPVRATMLTLASTVKADIQTCKIYVPPLKFVSQVGLGNPKFNTIRLGSAWFDRLSIDDVVALINKDNKLIEYARVTKVVAGKKAHILKHHGANNHLAMEQIGSVTERANWLADKIPNIFGKMMWDAASSITAIYLKRFE